MVDAMDTGSNVNIACRQRGRVTIVDLSGRLIVSANEEEIAPLRSTIQTLIADGRTTVALNMAELETIDARGLGELVYSLTSLRQFGGGLTLVAPRRKVRKLLAVTRLDGVLPVCDSEVDAILASNRGRGSADASPFKQLANQGAA